MNFDLFTALFLLYVNLLVHLCFAVTSSQSCAGGCESGSKQEQRSRLRNSRRSRCRCWVRWRRRSRRRAGRIAIVTAVNEGKRNSREEQERPLREPSGNEDLAAITNRAFDLTLVDRLNAELLVLTRDRYTGDDRVGLDSALSSWSIITAWSRLLSAAFLARVLRNKSVELEIQCALRNAKRLDHLIDCYWFS